MPSGAQEKEKHIIIKEIEKARKQGELLKTNRKGNLIQHLQQHQLGEWNGNLFGAFNILKHGEISSPENHEKLGQELPNHKVLEFFNVSAFCVHCHLFFCSRFWLIIS